MMILLKSNNYIESREYLEGLIKDYKADFGRFINDDIEEDVDYLIIPDFLSQYFA